MSSMSIILTEAEEEEEGSGPLKLAIVGRPNAGKSTLVNKMLGEERMITGPEAGITRDSISLDWLWNDKRVRLVDTAGLRKRAKVEDKLEKLSAWDTKRAIDHAEVVVLLLDATRGLEVQDLKIADQVLEEGRALVIALNKWDVAEHASSLFNGVKAALEEGLSQLKGVPLLTVSGKTGKGIDQLLGAAFEVRENWSRRVDDRRAQPLVRAGDRGQSAARAGRQADQASLHHPGEIAAAELRRVRNAGRSAANQLPALFAEFDAAGTGPGAGAAAHHHAGAEEPLRPKGKITLSFTLSGLGMVRGTAPGPGVLGSIRHVDDGSDIIDWVHFEKSRAELGPGFIRILSYFREDGAKSVYAIEQAMHEQNTVALVIPAHTLKGESRQFGAEALAVVAEKIEQTARFCIETHRFPDELVPDVVELRAPVEPDGRAVRQGDQPAAEPRAGRRRLRPQGRQPGLRADLGRERLPPLLPHRLQFPAGEAAPGPFERPVVEPFQPGLRPGQHDEPHQRHQQPRLPARQRAVEAQSPAVEDERRDDRGAEIIGEGAAAGGGDALRQPALPARGRG